MKLAVSMTRTVLSACTTQICARSPGLMEICVSAPPRRGRKLLRLLCSCHWTCRGREGGCGARGVSQLRAIGSVGIAAARRLNPREGQAELWALANVHFRCIMSVCLPVCLSVCMPTCLSCPVSRPACLSTCLPVCPVLSVSLPACLCAYLSVLSYQSACLSVRQSGYLPAIPTYRHPPTTAAHLSSASRGACHCCYSVGRGGAARSKDG